MKVTHRLARVSLVALTTAPLWFQSAYAQSTMHAAKPSELSILAQALTQSNKASFQQGSGTVQPKFQFVLTPYGKRQKSLAADMQTVSTLNLAMRLNYFVASQGPDRQVFLNLRPLHNKQVPGMSFYFTGSRMFIDIQSTPMTKSEAGWKEYPLSLALMNSTLNEVKPDLTLTALEHVKVQHSGQVWRFTGTLNMLKVRQAEQTLLKQVVSGANASMINRILKDTKATVAIDVQRLAGVGYVESGVAEKINMNIPATDLMASTSSQASITAEKKLFSRFQINETVHLSLSYQKLPIPIPAALAKLLKNSSVTGSVYGHPTDKSGTLMPQN